MSEFTTIKETKVVVLFRSKEASANIASMTKNEIDSDRELKGLDLLGDVEFINLEKRSYKKLFAKHQYIENVLLWEDEEVVSEYLDDHYPNITQTEYNSECTKHNKKLAKLVKSMLMSELLNNSKQVTYYELDKRSLDVSEKTLSEYELMKLEQRAFAFSKPFISRSKAECEKKAIELAKSDFESAKSGVACAEVNLKNKKKELKEKQVRLKRIELRYSKSPH